MNDLHPDCHQQNTSAVSTAETRRSFLGLQASLASFSIMIQSFIMFHSAARWRSTVLKFSSCPAGDPKTCCSTPDQQGCCFNVILSATCPSTIKMTLGDESVAESPVSHIRPHPFPPACLPDLKKGTDEDFSLFTTDFLYCT